MVSSGITDVCACLRSHLIAILDRFWTVKYFFISVPFFHLDSVVSSAYLRGARRAVRSYY